ncbi:HSP20-like chaperone [Aspergillus aurantiobrunneus]
MSLFRTIPTPGDFSPLFHLLDDYDNHRSARGQVSMRSFAPRFDVRETSDAYHLDGELPGIPQNNIDIEFTDPQTIVIKGRSEREYHHSSDNNNTAAADKQPRVETESEGDTPNENREVSKLSGDQKVSAKPAKPRFWASERSVGEFQRTFSFPTRVNQDDVSASLKDGILSLVVPKAAPPALKKITIQ